jgi:hypothetical protein
MKLEYTCTVERDGELKQEFVGTTEIVEGQTLHCFKATPRRSVLEMPKPSDNPYSKY